MVGFTLNINPAKNEYMRMTVEVSEIDTDMDVVAQLRACHETLHQTMQWADKTMFAKIEEETKKQFVAVTKS
jgi:hypothetical protein